MRMEKQTVRDIPRRKFLEMSMKGGLLIAATPALMSQLISCREGIKASSGMDMDKETLSKIISKALEKGGDFADVYLENRISRQIVMEESIFKSGLYGISQGAGDPEGLPSLHMACGLQDELLPVNRWFYKAASSAGLDIHYVESKGAHEWLFWGEQLKRWLQVVL